MWRRAEDAAARPQFPAGRPASASPVPALVSGESAEERAEEEVLLALRTMCQSGLRHPLHGHSYSRYTALRPRVCCSCEAPVFGPFSKACRCLTCGIIVHRQCVQRITRVPCGSYRGLRDPEGLHSRVATAGGKTLLEGNSGIEVSAAVAARSERKAGTDAPPAGPGQVSVQKEEAEEGKVVWQRNNNTKVHVNSVDGDLDGSATPGGEPEAAAASLPPSLSSSPSDNNSSLSTSGGGGARRMTYDALARVGALVGSMVGGGGGSGDGKEASAVGSSTSSSSSIFSFSALRGAGAVAGAYTGYRQQGGGDRRYTQSPWGGGGGGQRTSSIGGSSDDAAAPPSPVAMAWSRLAQRLSRPEGTGGPGAFMDLATFALSLEEEAVDSDSSRTEARNGSSSSSSSSSSAAAAAATAAAAARNAPSSTSPLIGQILRSPLTPPGYAWAACLDHFAARHAASASTSIGLDRANSPNLTTKTITTTTTTSSAEGEGGREDDGEAISAATPAAAEKDEASVPAGSCCEDAAAIIHEVALVLMEYVPGLLGSSLEAYEEAFEAVETEIMTTLYPSVLRECKGQVRYLSRAVEAWYRQQPVEQEGDGGKEEEEEEEGHYQKAARELVGMSREVTGRKKVQRVLGACLALGEGNLVMTADELLPALGRVVLLARVPALPAHLAFIEETCDTGALLGVEGYALTSLQVVVSLIITPPTVEVGDGGRGGRGEGREGGDEEGEEEGRGRSMWKSALALGDGSL